VFIEKGTNNIYVLKYT